MPRNGSGTFTLPPGSAAVSSATISSTAYNDALDDIATALTDSWSKSGNGAATADLSMGSHKLTNLATGTNPSDAIRLDQISGVYQLLDAGLTALAALSTTGIIARTAADTYVPRTITASAPLAVSNGGGVSGAPAFSLDVAGLTEETAPDTTADFLLLSDTSGSDYNKLKLQTLPLGIPHVILEDQQSSGTDGGTATSGADQTRVLNTEVRDVLGVCSLSSNQFTLTTGTYYIEWSAPAAAVAGHQTLLRDVSNSANLDRGTTEASTVSTTSTIRSTGQSVVTIAGASNAYEIRHRVNTTRATNGYGVAASFGTEVYTRVKIWKLA